MKSEHFFLFKSLQAFLRASVCFKNRKGLRDVCLHGENGDVDNILLREQILKIVSKVSEYDLGHI